MENKHTRLFLILGSFFIANAIIAGIYRLQVFSLEQTLGFDPLNFMFMGERRSFDMTAGVLLWPVVFVMTDIINEYFGHRGEVFLLYRCGACGIFIPGGICSYECGTK